MSVNGTATVSRVPPCVPKDPILGHLRYIKRDVFDLLFRSAKLGGISSIHLGPQRAYILYDPDYIRYVLQDNAKNYEKHARAFVRLRRTLGNGLLFNAGGDFWLRQRRIAQPAFHRSRIEGFSQLMAQAADDLVSELESLAQRGGTVDIGAEMVKVTMRIASLALFGAEVPEDTKLVRDAFTAVVLYIDKPGRQLIDVRDMLFGPKPHVRRALEALDRIVRKIIGQRRASREPRSDLLSMLMEARDDDGKGMTDTQLCDEIRSIFLAGHETTSNVLSWTWYCFSKNPAVRRALQDELARTLGGRTPALADIPHLGLTRRVIDETMRLYPPVWMLQRSAVNDDVIGGYRIPAGSLVCISAYVVHRLPEYWDNPEGFDPDRFLPERENGRPKFAYIPFSAGPRICIGNTFALMEAHILLATLAQHFDFDLPPGRDVKPELLITLRPNGTLDMSVRPRRASSQAPSIGMSA